MRTSSIAVCALPGLLLGACLAANAAQPQQPASAAHTPAIDAKTGRLLRPLTLQERRNISDEAAIRMRHVKQPRTEAEARPTLRPVAGGGVMTQVPTDLWSSQAAQADAQGKMRVREFEGNDAPVMQQEDVL